MLRTLGATLLLLAANPCVLSFNGEGQQGGDTSFVSETPSGTSRTLLKALAKEHVTNIVLVGDYSIAKTHEFDTLMGSPFPVNRNITIQGMPGTWPTLDLNFAYEIIELCSTCLLHFKGNLTIANDRRGTNPTYDFVVGKPGARVWCDNVYRQRMACTSGKESAETIRRLKRSSLWPNPNASQIVRLVDVTYKGKLYPESVYVEDASFDVPYARIEGRGHQGGYSQNCKAVTRICDNYVDPDCLQREGPDACVNHLIDKLLAETQKPPGPSPTVLAVAVAVPIVVAVVLLAAAWMFTHRRRKARELRAGGLDFEKGTTDSHLETNKGSTQDMQTGKSGRGGRVIGQPRGTGKDWELISSFSNPHSGFGTDCDSIEFGELIGSGSFGRVYQAMYCGRTVAIKVMEHQPEATETVQNEMVLQMSFNNRCVVAAYKCLTYARTGGGEDSSCDSSAEEFSLYVAPMSTYNSTACSTSGGGLGTTPLAHRSSEWRGLNSTCTRGLTGTPPMPVSGGSGHPNSSRVSGDDRVCATKHATWLLQEYCDLGTLKDYVIRSGLPPRLKLGDHEAMAHLLQLLHDSATGLAALHSAAVVHGDLNCRNCLVASDSGAKYGVCAKIADLGVSRALTQHKTHRTTQNLGTITHTAPELLRFGRMSPASDIYSFGIMMHALYTGDQPFEKLLYGQFFETVVINDLRPVVPSHMPQQFAMLMEHCWATQPEERPTVEQLLETLEYLMENLPAQMAQAVGRQQKL